MRAWREIFLRKDLFLWRGRARPQCSFQLPVTIPHHHWTWQLVSCVLCSCFISTYSVDKYGSLLGRGPTFSLSFKRARARVTSRQKVKSYCGVMKALGLYLALIFSWVNAVPVEEDKPAEPQARFLSPLALEGIGRIFKLQSELVSCYRCSMDYPQHASACCIQGYPNCCSVSNLALPGNGELFSSISSISFQSHFQSNCWFVEGYSTGNSYGHSLSFGGLSFVKDGLCPVSSPVSQLSLHSCTNQCDSDVQCIGDFKCCLYGCTRLCAKPQLGSLGLNRIDS